MYYRPKIISTNGFFALFNGKIHLNINCLYFDILLSTVAETNKLRSSNHTEVSKDLALFWFC